MLDFFGNKEDMKVGSQSIWNRTQGFMPSCSSTSNADTDIANVSHSDSTLLNVDITRCANDKRKCFHYEASACPFNINHVSRLQFDVTMQNCDTTWAAPLWLVPKPYKETQFDGNMEQFKDGPHEKRWGPEQGLSGEIDLLETCCGNTNMSFGAKPSEHHTYQDSNFTVKRRVRADFVNGDVLISTCKVTGEGKCVKDDEFILESTRTGYLNDVARKSFAQDGDNFVLKSDIWNGIISKDSAEDAGGMFHCLTKGIDSPVDARGTCENKTDPNNTGCRYEISSVQMVPNLEKTGNKQVFGTHATSATQCSQLNARCIPRGSSSTALIVPASMASTFSEAPCCNSSDVREKWADTHFVAAQGKSPDRIKYWCTAPGAGAGAGGESNSIGNCITDGELLKVSCADNLACQHEAVNAKYECCSGKNLGYVWHDGNSNENHYKCSQ